MSVDVLISIIENDINLDVDIKIPLHSPVRAIIEGKEYKIKGGSKLKILERLGKRLN